MSSTDIGDYDVDGVNRAIYWTQPEDGIIRYLPLGGGSDPVTLYSGIQRPDKMALDLKNRFVLDYLDW